MGYSKPKDGYCMRIWVRSLFFLLAFGIFSTSLIAVDRSAYNDALELYKSDRNEDSLALFRRFIEQYPESVKADDARWYMGRILRKLDRDDEAIIEFREVLKDKDSNRYEEAAYDLGKLYYYRRDYPQVLTIFSFIDEITELNSYHLRGLELRSRAYYRLAFKEKMNYRDEKSRELFKSSLKGYEIIESQADDPSDLSRTRFSMAKIYNYLADMTYESDQYDEYRNEALRYARSSLPHIDADDKDRAESLIQEIEDSESVTFAFGLEAMAGIDNLSEGTFGAEAGGSGSVLFPSSGTNIFELEASYKHNSFDFITSNFDPLKTGDARMVQWAELVGLGLDWRTGARRQFYNKLGIYARYQFAEDNRDNYFQAGLSEYGSLRFDRKWRLLWNGDFHWETFPNYQNSGRKLDAVEFSFEPELRLYAAEWLEVSLLYGFGLKPYIDSKYDTADAAVPSDLNKMNMSNSGSFALDFSPGKVYKAEAVYEFTYSKTFNYDYWVTGQPADRYVEGYYDYISHKISLDNRLRAGDRFELNLDGSLKFTNFLNYPSRDETRTFTDENRSDISLNLDAEASYMIYETKGGTELEAILSGWWDYKVSTMKYNTTFDTNYSFAGVLLGLSLKSP